MFLFTLLSLFCSDNFIYSLKENLFHFFMNLQIYRFLGKICCMAGWLCSLYADAGNDQLTVGAKQAAMGYIRLHQSDAFATFNNPAALGSLQQFGMAAYVENRFLLPELNRYAVAASFGTRSGTFGAGAVRFGSDFYNETHLALAYGRALSQNLWIGADFDVLSIQADEYAGKTAFTFGVGAQYRLNDQLQAAAHLFNPLNIQLSNIDNDVLAGALSIALSYSPSERVLFVIESEKMLDKTLAIKGGVDYTLLKSLSLRAGFVNKPSLFTCGLGWHLGNIDVDFAYSYHPVLGHSPQVGVRYQRTAAPTAAETPAVP